MNWEKLRSPGRATFKNPNFQSLCELGKTCKNSQRLRFKSSNFESIDELGVCPNLSFSIENKMENLTRLAKFQT